MTAFTADQKKVLDWYTKRYGVKLDESATNAPALRFIQPDGVTYTQSIVFIEQWYRSHLKVHGRAKTDN